jgi:hypothetical protein
MKKLLISLAMVFGFAVSSLGSAQSDGFGVYSGFPVFIGGQFQTNNLRFSVGFGGYGIGGGADFMFIDSPIVTGSPDLKLSWHAGAGINAFLYTFGGFSGLYLIPHGLAGIEYQLPNSTISIYSELQLGFGIGLGSLSGLTGVGGLDFAGRFGAIFRP